MAQTTGSYPQVTTTGTRIGRPGGTPKIRRPSKGR